ncbi:MAG: pantoate kinase [Candidatus Heimdallarchaeaceae archaeon]
MVKYWVAGHITGIFEICDEQTNPLYVGSKGAGFSINRGIITEVEHSEDGNHVYFDEVEKKDAKVSENVLTQFAKLLKVEKQFLDINVFHTFEVPLSSGFGASAAGALSLSFCLNDFFDLGLSKEKIFQIAHIAEVEEGGGLGDIIGLYQAGWELRRKEGAPGIGITEPLIEDEKYIIATKAFGPLKTKDIIRNAEKKKNIINAGKKVLSKLYVNPSVSVFARNIQFFTEKCGLETVEVKEIVEQSKEYSELYVGQIMLGNGVFVLAKKRKELEKLLVNFIEEKIAKNTVRKL